MTTGSELFELSKKLAGKPKERERLRKRITELTKSQNPDIADLAKAIDMINESVQEHQVELLALKGKKK